MCISQTKIKHNLNGIEFNELLNETNNCVENFDHEVTQNWTDNSNILHYELTVLNDNTTFESVFLMDDQRSGLLVEMFDESGNEIITSIRSNNLHLVSQVLDTGVYSIYLMNEYSYTNSKVFFQIMAENSTLAFIGEENHPSIVVATVEGDLGEIDSNVQYNLTVTKASYFSFEIDSNNYITLNIKSNAIEGIKFTTLKYLAAGTYTINVSGSGPFELEVKSRLEYSATLTEGD